MLKIIYTKYINNDDYYLKILYKYNSRVFFYKYKNYLSLYFVFFYLYYNTSEPLNCRLCYNEIIDFYRTKYSIEDITKIYDTAFFTPLDI